MTLQLPDLKTLKKLLRYNHLTGDFIWILPPKSHPRLIGVVAGARSTGYILIKIGNQKYKSHRLAWLYFYEKEPPEFIDHKNGDPFDNRIENLRAASNPQNQANRVRNKGKDLPKGVRHYKGGKFQARITFEKKQISLGVHETVLDAEDAYFNASKKYYGEYARRS